MMRPTGEAFFEQCPTSDLIFATIITDFKICRMVY